jgi:hypothetical protein
VRQNTITASAEDVATARNPASAPAQLAGSADPDNGGAAAPAGFGEAPDNDDFDPLSGFLEELDEGDVASLAKTPEADARFTVDATEPVIEPDDDFAFDLFGDLESEFTPEQPKAPSKTDAPPSATPIAAPVSAASAPSLGDEPERVEAFTTRAQRGESVAPVAQKDSVRPSAPQPPAPQQQPKREQSQQSASVMKHSGGPAQVPQHKQQQQQNQRRDSHERQTQQQDRRSREAAPPQPQPPAPQGKRDNRDQQQHGKSSQYGQRPTEERRGDERRAPEGRRAEDRRGDERRHEEKRRGERHEQSPAVAPVVAEGAAPKTGKIRPGRLFGWFVSYENPDGRAIELREGKFFVTGSSIRATDLILEDPSISTPHALMAVSSDGGLMLQDLMSDRGVFVRSSDGGGGYRREEGTVRIAHGDWVRFGDVEFLVVMVPQGSKR